MPAVEITAAIIGAVAAAGSTAASAAHAEIANVGSGISTTLINQSDYDFDIESFPLMHGDWVDHPSLKLNSVGSIFARLRDETEQFLSKSSVTDKEIFDYFKDTYVAKKASGVAVRSAITSYEMRGKNMGSEGIVCLTATTNYKKGAHFNYGFGSYSISVDSPLLIYLLTRKIPGGEYGAGAVIVPEALTKMNPMSSKSLPNMIHDFFGFPVIAYHAIMDGSKTDFDRSELGMAYMALGEKLSDAVAFSEGGTKSISFGGLKVSFAGAASTEFVIE